MSIARAAISEMPFGAEPQASRKGLAPPMRRTTAKADAVQQPEPR